MMCFVLQVGTQKADRHLTFKFCVQAAETYIFNLKNIKAIKVMYTHVHPYQSAPPILGKRIQNLHRN